MFFLSHVFAYIKTVKNKSSESSQHIRKKPKVTKASPCIMLIVILTASLTIDSHQHNRRSACIECHMFQENNFLLYFWMCIKQKKRGHEKQVNKPVRNCTTNSALFTEKRRRKKPHCECEKESAAARERSSVEPVAYAAGKPALESRLRFFPSGGSSEAWTPADCLPRSESRDPSPPPRLIKRTKGSRYLCGCAVCCIPCKGCQACPDDDADGVRFVPSTSLRQSISRCPLTD